MITKMILKNDVNGNKTLYITRDKKTTKIQTNGNLPETHRNGIGSWTFKEVDEYLTAIA